MNGGQPYSFDFQSHPEARFPPLEMLSLDGYSLNDDSSDQWDWVRKTTWLEKKRQLESSWRIPSYSFLDDLEGCLWDLWESWNLANIEKQKKQEREKLFIGKDGLHRWFEAMDWSHLHTLELKGWKSTVGIEKFNSTTLPNLTNLTIDSPGSHHAALDFISNLTRPLMTLSLLNMGLCWLEPAVEAITRFLGETIEILAIRDNENHRAGLPPKTLNTTELSGIISLCPNLRKLDIDTPRHRYSLDDELPDIPRSTDHPLTRFILPATAPNLEHLVLRFASIDFIQVGVLPLKSEWRSRRFRNQKLDDPLFDQRNIKSMFHWFRLNNPSKNLKKLEVHVGNWEDDGYRGIGNDRIQVARWICDLDEKQREQCAGGVSAEDDWMDWEPTSISA